MEIIYVLVNIILITSVLLMKRKEQKIDIFKSIVIILGIKLCYNIVLCYINNAIKIPITLLNLSIESLLISCIFIFKIIKQKEIQKYYFEKRDLVFIFIFISFIVVLIFFVYNGIPFNMKYLYDFGAHLNHAMDFSEKTTLIEGSTRPGAYINIGLLFKVVSKYIEKIELYNFFIVFDIFQLSMQGFLIYILSKKHVKNKIDFVIAVVISLIALITYSLHSLLSGFTYLSLAMMFIVLRSSYNKKF